MLKARDVGRALIRKGFTEVQRDHRYYFFYYNGRKSNIYTKISHGVTDISDHLCSGMARQMRLTGPQFHDFIECPLTVEAYTRILIESNQLDSN